MQRTRRAVLSGIGTAGVVALTGCLGGGDDTGSTAYDCDGEAPSPDLDYRPALGDPDANIVVQAFGDFTCGHCGTFKREQFPSIREAYIDPGEIRYEHWDFPIPVDEDWAVPVASAARGVGAREGDEAFFTFSSAIYESLGEYSFDAIGAAAEGAGADPCLAIADADAASYEPALISDRDEGELMGVSGTPTVFVNGQRVESSAAAVSDAIDAAQS